MITEKTKKKQKLRNNEYYDIQEMLDNLYEQSFVKQNFMHIVMVSDLIGHHTTQYQEQCI